MKIQPDSHALAALFSPPVAGKIRGAAILSKDLRSKAAWQANRAARQVPRPRLGSFGRLNAS